MLGGHVQDNNEFDNGFYVIFTSDPLYISIYKGVGVGLNDKEDVTIDLYDIENYGLHTNVSR